MKKFNIKNWLILISSSFLSGYLGALGGADNSSKAWRRIAIPFTIVSLAYNKTENLWVLLSLSLIGVLGIGYGIPDETDEGSTLAKFIGKPINFDRYSKNSKKALLLNILVRFVISSLKCISIVPIAFFVRNLDIWGVVSIGIILNEILWGAIVHPKQMFVIFNKKLLLEEFLIHSINTGLMISILFI